MKNFYSFSYFYFISFVITTYNCNAQIITMVAGNGYQGYIGNVDNRDEMLLMRFQTE